MMYRTLTSSTPSHLTLQDFCLVESRIRGGQRVPACHRVQVTMWRSKSNPICRIPNATGDNMPSTVGNGSLSGRVPILAFFARVGFHGGQFLGVFDSLGHDKVRGAPQALKRGVFADDLRHE